MSFPNIDQNVSEKEEGFNVLEENDFIGGLEDTKIKEINIKYGKEKGNYIIDEPNEMVEEREDNMEFLHRDNILASISFMVDTQMYNEMNFLQRTVEDLK